MDNIKSTKAYKIHCIQTGNRSIMKIILKRCSVLLVTCISIAEEMNVATSNEVKDVNAINRAMERFVMV